MKFIQKAATNDVSTVFLGGVLGGFSGSLVALLFWLIPFEKVARPLLESPDLVIVLAAVFGTVAGAIGAIVGGLVSRARRVSDSEVARAVVEGAAANGVAIGGGFAAAIMFSPHWAPAVAVLLSTLPFQLHAFLSFRRVGAAAPSRYLGSVGRALRGGLIGALSGILVEVLVILALIVFLPGERATELTASLASIGLALGFWGGVAMEAESMEQASDTRRTVMHASEAGLVLSLSALTGIILGNLLAIPVGILAATVMSTLWSQTRTGQIRAS